MMREQARNGLQVELDTAVTNGDTAAAKVAADKIAALAVSAAPKAPTYDALVRTELDKQEWFGTDPKRSAKAVEFGKTMDPKKFATPAAFAEAIVKAVDAEFKPAAAADEPDDDEPEDDAAKAAAAAKPARKTDGPSEGDGTQRNNIRRASAGPWTKLSDAPSDVQKEVNRTADKFAPKTKEGRDAFVKRALESHYTIHQRKAGK